MTVSSALQAIAFVATLAIISSIDTAALSTSYKEIQIALLTLEKLVNFYNGNANSSNIDGIFGLRVFEGFAKRILTEFNSEPVFSQSETAKTIAKLVKTAESVAERGEASLKLNKRQAYESLRPFVSRPYQTRFTARYVHANLVWDAHLNTDDSYQVVDEQTSDECFSSLARLLESTSSAGCVLDQKCVKTMLTFGLKSYPLLHQILFSAQIDMIDWCDDAWAEALSKIKVHDSSDLQRILCSNSFNEMLRLVKQSSDDRGGLLGSIHVTAHNQDVFFEHLFVCPSIGFSEFLKPEYLSFIANNQDESGCFKADHMSGRKQRTLQEEKELEDGCLFHKTSVATGAVSVFLYYNLLREYNHSKLQKDLMRDSENYANQRALDQERSRHHHHDTPTHYVMPDESGMLSPLLILLSVCILVVIYCVNCRSRRRFRIC